MNDEIHCGESSTRFVTKQELMEIIDKNFSDKSSHIATITTLVDSTDYHNRKIYQSIAIAKILEI